MRRPSKPVRFYAISGSLRAASVHSALVRALQDNAPEGVDVIICDALGILPIFSPDREGEATPQSVRAFADEVDKADALIVASPEYAHGIPGGLKNAFDWLVSGPELVGKPVMLAHAYSHGRGQFAQAALEEVFKTASLQVVPGERFSVPLVGKTLEEAESTLETPDVRRSLAAALADLRAYISAPD